MNIALVLEVEVNEFKITKKDKEKLTKAFPQVKRPADKDSDAVWFSMLKALALVRKSKMRAIQIVKADFPAVDTKWEATTSWSLK